jgi:hypothetical protein
MALAEIGQRPVQMAHRRVVAQMEQMKVNFRPVELPSVVVRVAKTRWPLGNCVRMSRCTSSYLAKKGSRSRGILRTGAA